MKSNVAAYNQTNTKMPKKTGALSVQSRVDRARAGHR